jgi:LmbE family N-acetylglucosaminyl deacetylase
VDIIPARALAIVAHPDDIEYFCGGTLAYWIKNGCHVSYLVASSGEKGSNSLSEDLDQLLKTRENEQLASAKVLGVENITFLRLPDSELSFTDHNCLRGEFVRAIRKMQAEVVLTHDPLVRTTRQHPDHRIVGQLTIDACFPISSIVQCYKEQIIEEGLQPCQPSFVFLFGTDQANYWVDISDTIDQKVHSLQMHTSQESAFPGGIEKRLRWKAKNIGSAHNILAAEEFLLIKVGATLPDTVENLS